MGKPKAPEAPDPQETAAAQTGTNVATAVANSTLNQFDSFGPDGSTTYSQTGTTNFTDPTTGQTYEIPRYAVTQELSEGQQQIYDNNQAAQTSLSGIAQDQSAFLRDYLSEPVSFDNLPEYGQLNDNSGQIQNGYQQQQLQNVRSRGPQFQQFAGDANLQEVGQNQARLQNGYNATQAQGFQGNLPQLQRQGGTANLNTDLGTTNLQNFTGQTPQYQTSYVDDFSADRASVEASLNANLDRQHSRDEESLNARLADQGIQLGSEAYTRAHEDFQNAKDRSRIDANLSAGQEQSRLAALSQAQASFGNQAQGQSFNDALTAQNFNNNVAGQQFGQNAQAAQFENAARQQDYDNSQGIVRENNQYSQQDFGNQLQSLDTQNQARLANNALSSDQAQFFNTANQQAYSNQLGADNQNNALRQNTFDNFNSAAAQNNQNAQQSYGNYVNQIGLNNQTAQTNNQNNAAQAGFNNQATQQQFNQGLQAANYQNELRERELQQTLTERNQPLNEIGALLSGSQVSRPEQFQGPQSNIATTDYAGLVQQNFQNQNQLYNQQLQQWNGALGQVFGAGSAIALSDRRLKKDIKPIGKLKNGLTIYLFKYIGQTIERVGLMAQEVAKFRPEAIVPMKNGFMAVDYSKAVK